MRREWFVCSWGKGEGKERKDSYITVDTRDHAQTPGSVLIEDVQPIIRIPVNVRTSKDEALELARIIQQRLNNEPIIEAMKGKTPP